MNDRALRICHVATERSWRGGEQQVLSLVEGLAARGHSNTAAVRRSGELSKRLAGHFPLIELSPAFEWDPWAAHRLNRHLRAERIDILHAHTGHAVALAAFASLGTGIPMVVTRRVDFPIGRNPLSKWKYARASRVIAISTAVRNVLRSDGIPGEKISLIPSGIDFRRFENIRPKSKKEMGVPDDAVVIGQVAALAPHKDQSTFLKALARLIVDRPNVHGVLVGAGALRASLESEASALGISERVRFVGYQSDALSWLAGFDVFCLSSSTEGLGTSILDAMALRIPVVATQAGGIPELVQEGVTGFLAPIGDSVGLREAITRCLSAGSELSTICSNAYEKAQKFNISRTVEGVEALYRTLVQSRETSS